MKRRIILPVEWSCGWHALSPRRAWSHSTTPFAKPQGVLPGARRCPVNRRGGFLIIAMICLLLTTGLMGALLKMAVLNRRAAQFEAHALQAEWLAESALDRAAAKLSGDGDYQGETWRIPADDLGGSHAGEVQITIKPGQATNVREMEAIARFPSEGSTGAKRTKRLLVTVSTPSANDDPADSPPASAEKRSDR